MFDQTDVDGIPKQYFSNGTMEGICTNGIDVTDGQMLYSQSQMFNQRSCKPNVGNAGNYYSFPGATAGSNISGGNALDSVCPRGWMINPSSPGDAKSFNSLISTTYKISNGDAGTILLKPLTFFRFGFYERDGSLTSRTSIGYYWTSQAYSSGGAYCLYITDRSFNTQGESQGSNSGKNRGFSLRCVSSGISEISCAL